MAEWEKNGISPWLLGGGGVARRFLGGDGLPPGGNGGEELKGKDEAARRAKVFFAKAAEEGRGIRGTPRIWKKQRERSHHRFTEPSNVVNPEHLAAQKKERVEGKRP